MVNYVNKYFERHIYVVALTTKQIETDRDINTAVGVRIFNRRGTKEAPATDLDIETLKQAPSTNGCISQERSKRRKMRRDDERKRREREEAKLEARRAEMAERSRMKVCHYISCFYTNESNRMSQ